jgi:hypothetical protein
MKGEVGSEVVCAVFCCGAVLVRDGQWVACYSCLSCADPGVVMSVHFACAQAELCVGDVGSGCDCGDGPAVVFSSAVFDAYGAIVVVE